MNAFVRDSVSDTGLLAIAFVITFRDGTKENFNGTASDYDSDDEGTAMMVHCTLVGEPELMDRVSETGSGLIYHISSIKQDAGIYSLTLVREARFVR
jgi:hypothetical protein